MIPDSGTGIRNASSRAAEFRHLRVSPIRQHVASLTLLDNAEALGDLAALPSNRLEALQGDRAGQHSIRINAQWRICFRWTRDGPCEVEIVDYH